MTDDTVLGIILLILVLVGVPVLQALKQHDKTQYRQPGEQPKTTSNASVGNTHVDWKEQSERWEKQRKLDLAIDTTKPLWEGWKASEREMTGPLNGWKPFLAWEKPDPALEGKTVLNLPKTLFVASDTSSDLPGDNISRSTTTLIMSSPGVLTMSRGHITYSAHSIGHNSGLAEFKSPVSFEELPRLISNSKDPKASKYIGMTEDNWRSFMEDPVLQLPIPPYPLLWFGHYRQGLFDTNERIAWYVLDIVDGHAFLLSKFCLDCKPWHLCDKAAFPSNKWLSPNLPPVTWQDSSLRDWLNREFVAKAFSQKELHGIRAQDGTGSRITLPTEEEMKHYFPQDNLRAAKPTPYAVTQGAHAYTYSDSVPQYRVHVGNTLYWLRDPYKRKENYMHNPLMWSTEAGIVSVYWDGSSSIYSYYRDFVAVRPSLWLNLKSAFGKQGARSFIDAWERH